MKLTALTEANLVQVWGLNSIPAQAPNKYSRLVCPVLLTSPAIIILVSSAYFTTTWAKCGYLSGEIRSGLTVGSGPDCRIGNRRIIYGNRLQLVTFPDRASTYSLIFDAMLTGEIQLFVWEYIGEVIE
jgi:hypothetical protein